MQLRLQKSGIATADQCHGCNEEEIVSIESRMGFTLPSAYKEFLRAFGHSAGGFWQDADFSFKKLDRLNCQLRETLAELETIKL